MKEYAITRGRFLFGQRINVTTPTSDYVELRCSGAGVAIADQSEVRGVRVALNPGDPFLPLVEGAPLRMRIGGALFVKGLDRHDGRLLLTVAETADEVPSLPRLIAAQSVITFEGDTFSPAGYGFYVQPPRIRAARMQCRARVRNHHATGVALGAFTTLQFGGGPNADLLMRGAASAATGLISAEWQGGSAAFAADTDTDVVHVRDDLGVWQVRDVSTDTGTFSGIFTISAAP